MSTLPHEREKMFLDDIIDDCLKGRDKLIIVVLDSYSTLDFIMHKTREIVEELELHLAKRIRMYREALEFDNGAKILFQQKTNNSCLRGLKPDRIVIMGKDAEFWYLLLAAGGKIEVAA